MPRHSPLFLILVLTLSWAFQASRFSSATEASTRGDSLREVKIAGHWVDIRQGKDSPQGNILVLPGWNFPRQDWCQKSSLCQKALARGYRLILPEMAKSMYAKQHYPETRQDWRGNPTRAWVVEEMIPFLQEEEKVMLPLQKNYVLGLSTGGRGVALLLQDLPELFLAGAALSGDFDQTLMPDDRLTIGYYGPYADFPTRWTGLDNPLQQAAKIQVPLYLGHGTEDKVVPVEQTQVFYQALRAARPQLEIVLNLPNAGHDYQYWDSEVENMLDFLDKH